MRWFFYGLDLLIPVMMIVFGRWMQKHCPKEINAAFGYRTRRSTQSIEAWRFAHARCGRLWQIVGWPMLALSAALALLRIFPVDDARLCGTLTMAQTVVLLLTIPVVEHALRRQFPGNTK